MEQYSPATPCLTLDLGCVAVRYREFTSAFPGVSVFYAVKANPHPAVISLLVEMGSCFDVASRAELDLCLDAGAPAERISFGNTIKYERDIAYAHQLGVELFAFDSECELRKIAAHAPGAAVYCRVLIGSDGARWPLSRKFGCAPDMAADLLELAGRLGLQPRGVSFHVGSQQLDPTRWRDGIALAAGVFKELRSAGHAPTLVNLGGGFPASYDTEVPEIGTFAAEVTSALADEFGETALEIMAEPGRFLVSDAGVLHSTVLLVSRKSYTDSLRWAYVDVGRFGGLAETENEAIVYPILCEARSGEIPGPAVLAGPTCDSMDILYEKTPPFLPLDLAAGDQLEFLGTGAYTASYSSVGFNGFPPLATHVFGGEDSLISLEPKGAP